MSSDFTEEQSRYCERRETLQHSALSTLAGHLKSQIAVLEFKGKLYKFTRPVLRAGYFFFSGASTDQILFYN